MGRNFGNVKLFLFFHPGIDGVIAFYLEQNDTPVPQLVCYGEALKNYIFEKGYDKKYGARPLKRAIQNEVEDKMAEEMLAGNIKAGQTVRISIVKAGVKFKVLE